MSLRNNLLREEKAIKLDQTLLDHEPHLYRLWCDPNSPYSCKLRTYMNYKEIPYKRVRINLHGYYNSIVKKVGMSIMPIIETPDNQVMQDTTPIIEEFESTFKSRSCIPDDNRLKFIMWLMEDFGDEYLPRFSMHYRWGNKQSRNTLSHRLGRSMSYGDLNMSAPKMAPIILSRQSAFDSHLGLSSDKVRKSLDLQLIDFLGLLESHFESYQFLLGDRPSVADFAIYGHLHAHLFNDPYSAELMEVHGPQTCNWLDTISEFGDTRGNIGQSLFGGWIDLDSDNIESLSSIITYISKTYIPFMSANALASTLGEKHFTTEIYSEKTEFSTFQYRAWSFENLQKRYETTQTEPKDWLNKFLTSCHILPGMMENGILHNTLFDGFSPPYVKNGVADARIQHLKNKKKASLKTKTAEA